jgi:hypothetical protein
VTDAGAGFDALSTSGRPHAGGPPARDGNAPTSPTGPTTRASVIRVGMATVLSALCGYTVLYLAARDLAPAGFSVFGVFWGAFGLVTGAAFGLLQEATREVRSAGYIVVVAGAAAPATSDAVPRTHPMRVAAMVGVVAAAVIAASSPLWSWHVFVASQWLSVALLSVGLAGFCLHTTLLGMLAGVNRWTEYGALMATDAVLRVVVAGVTFVVGWGLVGYLWAHTRRHDDISARRVALDRRRGRQRDPGDGVSGAAQGDLG